MQEQAWCPEGSEHGIGGLRMAPEGPVAPSGPPRPDLDSRGLVMHFRSRARLRRLLVRLRRPTPQRSLRSLRRRGFALYVRLRHYRSSLLAAASNSLTFVRGANRAYCAPRKRRCGLICTLRKWLCRPTKACLYRQPARPPLGHWRAHPAAAPCRRGADRACCAPRKRRCGLIYAPRKWLCRPTKACLYQPPHAPRRGIGVHTRPRRILPPVGFRGNAPDRRRHLPLPGGDGAAEAASDENRAEAAVAPDAGCRAEVAGAPAFDQSGFADQGA